MKRKIKNVQRLTTGGGLSRRIYYSTFLLYPSNYRDDGLGLKPLSLGKGIILLLCKMLSVIFRVELVLKVERRSEMHFCDLRTLSMNESGEVTPCSY